jgi:Domain of unknown function (DUF4440)
VVEVAVLDAVVRRSRALETGDADELRRHLHPGFRWTSYRGETFDRDGYIESNTSGRLRWRRQDLEARSVVVDGDTAVVVGVVVDEVERDGERETYRLLITMTWVFRHDRWLCLAGHAGPQVHA